MNLRDDPQPREESHDAFGSGAPVPHVKASVQAVQQQVAEDGGEDSSKIFPGEDAPELPPVDHQAIADKPQARRSWLNAQHSLRRMMSAG